MHVLTDTQTRLYDKLLRDLGERILGFLRDSTVHEVLCNPDGHLWIDTQQEGLKPAGKLTALQAHSLVESVAGFQNRIVNIAHPCIEAEFPFWGELQGERFTAQVPPIVKGVSFSIRKKSNSVFALDDYVSEGLLSLGHADFLRHAIFEHKNILVCGGPGSGKTTFTNALLLEAIAQDKSQRFLLLEDVPELQCPALNTLSMVTMGDIKLPHLLSTALRMRPDRIVVGEVRGAEALTLLKAWNTGCPGGFSTVHANGAVEAVQRVCDLAMEAGLVRAPINLVAQTIHIIVSVKRKGSQKGVIDEIILMEGADNEVFQFKKVA